MTYTDLGYCHRRLFAHTALFAALFMASLQNAVAATCDDKSIDATAVVNGWSESIENHRFVDTKTDINADNVNQLQVKWVFGVPDTEAPRTLPLVTGDTVVIGDGGGVIFALDRDSGCEKWRTDVGDMPRTAFRLIHTVRGPEVYFGTMAAEVVILDLLTGAERARVKVSDHPRAMLSGTAAEHNGVVYQPVSSWELFFALNPFYACCTFRGSVVALSTDTWEPLWQGYTIETPAQVVKSRMIFPDHKGPSGAPVWSAPTIDVKRKRLYVGTGQNYSSPATKTSDAIVAFDLSSGELLWSQQFLPGDAWNVACVVPGHGNCPDEAGDDLDFGAPPVLVSHQGRDYLLAGQKSGRIYALDPDDNGKLIWQRAAGSGSKAGGVHFGLAADQSRGVLYVPISDRHVDWVGSSHKGTPNPSLQALDIATGEPRWVTPAPGDCMKSGKPMKNCHVGFSAAITATPDLIFAPTLDGYLRVFAASDGRQLWSSNTARDFDAVNDTEAYGGALDMGGALLAGRQLLISSGYGQFNQMGGNAFIVYELTD